MKLRQDVVYMAGDKDEVGFVTHPIGEEPTRPTISVGAYCTTKSDRDWFVKVLRLIETIEVPE